MDSSLTSPLLRNRADTGDVAQTSLDLDEPSASSLSYTLNQLPPSSTDDRIDTYVLPRRSNAGVPTLFTDVNGPAHCEGRCMNYQEPVLLPRRKCRLVWDGYGFRTGSPRICSGHQDIEFRRSSSHPKDELRKFRRSLYWMALDQSTKFHILISWGVALFLTIAVPVCYLVFVDTQTQHPFDRLVQLSESALALISFFTLSRNLRKHGLRRFLFLDRITLEPIEVQTGYTGELNRAFGLLRLILLLSFVVELPFQVWWFTCAPVHLPFVQDLALRRIIMCIAVMLSWVYKTTVFLLPCILFRLMCCLQDLRFEGYVKMLEHVSDVSVLLKEYTHLRQQLNVVSHRYRLFIVLSLVAITASQFIFLLMMTATSESVSLFTTGNLGVCSVVQLIGFVICLHGAARITHKAQRIVSIVSQWHALSTCQNAEGMLNPSSWVDEADQLPGTEEDNDWHSALHMCSTNYLTNDNVATFQMRQAFVSFIQRTSMGISIFGFMLDRMQIQMLLMIEMTLVLWALSQTIGF
ncbi:hypothetical protein KP509_33G013800 [Ceratopteris richardii]|uniref:Uncharacterized protein n=1 Tax=Ceratopteris richardii TaxID=49495 RepID=A0A8T2QMV2_CERRI|nr:hypothetical protein KP509_33G013800 [Ceratopteris richardii]